MSLSHSTFRVTCPFSFTIVVNVRRILFYPRFLPFFLLTFVKTFINFPLVPSTQPPRPLSPSPHDRHYLYLGIKFSVILCETHTINLYVRPPTSNKWYLQYWNPRNSLIPEVGQGYHFPSSLFCTVSYLLSSRSNIPPSLVKKKNGTKNKKT